MISRCMRTCDPEVSDHLDHTGRRPYLLTETDPGTCIEREEDEWVRNEVLLYPFVQETVGVEFQSYPVRKGPSVLSICCRRDGDYHPVPIGPFYGAW